MAEKFGSSLRTAQLRLQVSFTSFAGCHGTSTPVLGNAPPRETKRANTVPRLEAFTVSASNQRRDKNFRGRAGTAIVVRKL